MQNTTTEQPHSTAICAVAFHGALSMMHRVPFMHTCPTGIIHWTYCNVQFLSLQFPTFTGEVHQLLVVDSLVRVTAMEKTCAIFRTNPTAAFSKHESNCLTAKLYYTGQVEFCQSFDSFMSA